MVGFARRAGPPRGVEFSIGRATFLATVWATFLATVWATVWATIWATVWGGVRVWAADFGVGLGRDAAEAKDLVLVRVDEISECSLVKGFFFDKGFEGFGVGVRVTGFLDLGFRLGLGLALGLVGDWRIG